jgi:hypothetical protein
LSTAYNHLQPLILPPTFTYPTSYSSGLKNVSLISKCKSFVLDFKRVAYIYGTEQFVAWHRVTQTTVTAIDGVLIFSLDRAISDMDIERDNNHGIKLDLIDIVGRPQHLPLLGKAPPPAWPPPLIPHRSPSYVPLMSLLCPSYVPLMSLLCPLMSLLCPSYVPLMSLLCPSYVPLMSLLCPSYVPLMSLLCPSYVPLMSLLCPSYVPLMSLLCTSYVPLSLLCTSYVPLMYLLCTSYVPLMYLKMPSN